MKELNDENFEKFVKGKDGRVKGVKFGAVWCHPCQLLNDEMPKIIKKTPKVDWAKVDIDKCPKTSKKLEINAVPLIRFWKNGKMLKECVEGFDSADAITEIANRLAK